MLTLITSLLLVTAAQAETGDFTRHTANTLSDGQWSVGIFGPLRYGVKDNLELEINPLAALLAPHIAIKKSYSGIGDWTVASRHQLGYPTPLLKAFSKGGIGSLLAPDSVLPHTVVLQNDLYLGEANDNGEVTFSLGVNLALELGDSDYALIDAPYGFRQTNLYQNTLSLQFGMGGDYFFTEKLGFRYFTKGWYYPLAEQNWAIEEKVVLLIQVSDRSQASIGANYIVADYLYAENSDDNNWHILPSADWVWQF